MMKFLSYATATSVALVALQGCKSESGPDAMYKAVNAASTTVTKTGFDAKKVSDTYTTFKKAADKINKMKKEDKPKGDDLKKYKITEMEGDLDKMNAVFCTVDKENASKNMKQYTDKIVERYAWYTAKTYSCEPTPTPQPTEIQKLLAEAKNVVELLKIEMGKAAEDDKKKFQKQIDALNALNESSKVDDAKAAIKAARKLLPKDVQDLEKAQSQIDGLIKQLTALKMDAKTKDLITKLTAAKTMDVNKLVEVQDAVKAAKDFIKANTPDADVAAMDKAYKAFVAGLTEDSDKALEAKRVKGSDQLAAYKAMKKDWEAVAANKGKTFDETAAVAEYTKVFEAYKQAQAQREADKNAMTAAYTEFEKLLTTPEMKTTESERLTADVFDGETTPEKQELKKIAEYTKMRADWVAANQGPPAKTAADFTKEIAAGEYKKLYDTFAKDKADKAAMTAAYTKFEADHLTDATDKLIEALRIKEQDDAAKKLSDFRAMRDAWVTANQGPPAKTAADFTETEAVAAYKAEFDAFKLQRTTKLAAMTTDHTDFVNSLASDADKTIEADRWAKQIVDAAGADAATLAFNQDEMRLEKYAELIAAAQATAGAGVVVTPVMKTAEYQKLFDDFKVEMIQELHTEFVNSGINAPSALKTAAEARRWSRVITNNVEGAKLTDVAAADKTARIIAQYDLLRVNQALDPADHAVLTQAQFSTQADARLVAYMATETADLTAKHDAFVATKAAAGAIETQRFTTLVEAAPAPTFVARLAAAQLAEFISFMPADEFIVTQPVAEAKYGALFDTYKDLQANIDANKTEFDTLVDGLNLAAINIAGPLLQEQTGTIADDAAVAAYQTLLKEQYVDAIDADAKWALHFAINAAAVGAVRNGVVTAKYVPFQFHRIINLKQDQPTAGMPAVCADIPAKTTEFNANQAHQQVVVFELLQVEVGLQVADLTKIDGAASGEQSNAAVGGDAAAIALDKRTKLAAAVGHMFA